MKKNHIYTFIICFYSVFTIHAQTVTVDFATGADLPLVKKFDWMNSRFLDPNRYASTPCLDYFKACGTKSLRIEVGWGVSGSYTNYIGGTSGNLIYNLALMDLIATQMKNRSMGLYWSYAYNPKPLQNCNNDPFANPCDLSQWKTILEAMAAHWKNNDMRADYQGIWNEPDNSPDFYTGTLETFKPLYENGSKGLRNGDPDAVVGGPDFAATAGDKWLNEFLDYIDSTNSPMDFLSYHCLNADNETRLAPKRTALKARPYFNQTEIMVGELNPFSTADYYNKPTSPCRAWPSASAVFDVMNYYIQTPEVTRTFWAQGMAAGTGDELAAIAYTGNYRRPVYWANYFYNQMPIDRVKLTTNNGVKVFASTDGHNAAILLWVSNGSGNKNVTATFNNVPFTSGKLEVWRIDSTHNSIDNTGHDNTAPDVINVNNTNEYQWKGLILNGGTVLLKMVDSSNISELTPYPMGTLIRQHHYFYNRGDKSYGVFDRNTWITRMGMATNDYAVVEEGALFKDMPATIYVNVKTDGTPHKMDKNSLLSVNLDYRVNGVYTKSVIFHDSLYDSTRTSGHPFGKIGLPDQVVKVSFPYFNINFADYAPTGWQQGGDVLISYTMQNTGANTRAKITIRKGNVSSLDTSKYYKILVKNNTNYMLTIAGTTPNDGSNVGIATNNNSDNQIWKLVDLGNDYYIIQSKSNLKFVLDCSATPTDGTNVQSWTYVGNDRQQWFLEALDSNYYHVRVENNLNYFLDASGTNVQVWTDDNNDRQEWMFVPYDNSNSIVDRKNLINDQILIYPNPATTLLTVNSNQLAVQTVIIKDIQGRIIFKKNESFIGSQIIDVSGLENGLYFIKLQTDHNLIEKKIIINK